MHDAMVQIAFDQHDRQAQARRGAKMRSEDANGNDKLADDLDAAKAGSKPNDDGADDDGLEEGETLDDQIPANADDASSRADSTSPRKPGTTSSRAGSVNGRASAATPSRASGTPVPRASGVGESGTANLISSTYSANPLIRCLVCNRHVASNRYAPHLAKCMGLGAAGSAKNSSGGLKRKAAAGAAAANAAAAAAAQAQAPSTHSGSAANSSSNSGKMRGRPPKYGAGNKERSASARSTATPGL